MSTTLRERLLRTGIRRLGSPSRGFRYRHADGRPVTAAERERIQKLVLPPAWREVAIAPSAGAKLQATGVDARGRLQYRYHPSYRAKQESQKYRRLLAFARSLPDLRRTVRRDLRRPGLGRERVMACILRILSTCFIRPGSEVYARENGSYGIATLRPKHVRLAGDRIHFDFPGKSGQHQTRDLTDPEVAKVVRALLKVPGRDVFKFIEDDPATGKPRVVDVRRRHINGYIKEVMGNGFSAKDFRTWAGTLICACALAKAGFDPQEPVRLRKRRVVAAVKETAAQLGNTPAVCKSSYIYPAIISGFDRGRIVEQYFKTTEELVAYRGDKLHCSEEALVKLLCQKGAA